MAIPEKRSLGVWCKWIGALIFAAAGLIVIPKDKLVRASAAIRTLLDSGIEFSEYRSSLMGLLEHVRDVARLPRRAFARALKSSGAQSGSLASLLLVSRGLIRRGRMPPCTASCTTRLLSIAPKPTGTTYPKFTGVSSTSLPDL